MKKFRERGFLVLVGLLTIMLAGCLSPTKSEVKEFDPTTGKLVKETVTSESVAKTVVDSTKGKIVFISDQSWTGGVYFVPPASDAEDVAGVLKLLVAKRDFVMMTAPFAPISEPVAVNSIKGLADMVASGRAGEISVNANGINSTTQKEK